MGKYGVTHTIGSIKDMKALAVTFAKKIGEEGSIVCLQGDLGAGKTTFTQFFAKELGVLEKVVSPTFTIMKQYKTKGGRILWHVDLYRLDDISQILGLGLLEIINDRRNTVLIEWPEKIIDLLTSDYWNIKIRATGFKSRVVEIEKLEVKK